LLHNNLMRLQSFQLRLAIYLQNAIFSEWAMLGSNQRPLPCEVSTIVFWRFLEFAKSLQIGILSV
jgi:hypothetical protein